MPFPERFATLHLTRRCNSRCRFCVTDPVGATTEVPLDEADAFLAAQAGKGYEAYSLVGGEPTIYRHLEELLERAKAYGYPSGQMYTNGRRFADRAYAERLVELGVDTYVISMHGPDAETHDALTDARGSFDQAVEGIRNLKELGQSVATLSVITRPNHDKLRPMVEMLMSLDVDLINLSGLCPEGLAGVNWEEVRVPYTESMPYVEEAIQAVDAAGRDVVLEGFPFCAVRPHEHRCWEYPDVRREILFFQGKVIEDYDASLNTAKTHTATCDGCAVRGVCGGIYVRYLATYGDGELAPLAAYEPEKAALGRGLTGVAEPVSAGAAPAGAVEA